MNPVILHIALPVPLYHGFDYLLPQVAQPLLPGMRVRVPFGQSHRVGILLEQRAQSAIPAERLKPISAILDQEPILDTFLLALGHWISEYYRYPLGEVLSHMLPVRLRQGHPREQKLLKAWRLTVEGRQVDMATLSRAPRQQALLQLLQQTTGVTAAELTLQVPNWAEPMRSLQGKKLVESFILQSVPPDNKVVKTAPVLTSEQQQAVNSIGQNMQQFKTWLLHGVTGSGKTEVYLRLIQQALQQQKQVLLLVPEIGLTPQLLQRLQQRLTCRIGVLHSGLNNQQRLDNWIAAANNELSVIVGTRSAVFLPLAQPGLIIVDEEHDASFKQQEGLRYHGRDVAIMRAQQYAIPIVLGSATPSLETWHNAQQERYGYLALTDRPGGSTLPVMRIIDARATGQILLPKPVLEKMQLHLAAGNQVLLMLNRRGFAPAWLCHQCGWVAQCQRCDANLTLHQQRQRLCCHHCGHESRLIAQCPVCAHALQALGYGTERLETILKSHFPEQRILRIDRDVTRRKGELEQQLALAQSGQANILLGTQMLAKGHHFPKVTLVAVLGVDQGLFSADFRGVEQMAQLVIQVAGRAGRAEHPGEVLLLTHQPQHPVLQCLLQQGYTGIIKQQLLERSEATWPPFSYLALLRAEALKPDKALEFLRNVHKAMQPHINNTPIKILGPIPAVMERRVGYYRAQLLFQSRNRKALQTVLDKLIEILQQQPQRSQLRWSIDVDPISLE